MLQSDGLEAALGEGDFQGAQKVVEKSSVANISLVKLRQHLVGSLGSLEKNKIKGSQTKVPEMESDITESRIAEMLPVHSRLRLGRASTRASTRARVVNGTRRRGLGDRAHTGHVSQS